MTTAIRQAQLDAVLLWLTPVIEHDYDARGVFPFLRAREAVKVQNNGQSLHLLAPEVAADVLADAQALHRKPQPQRGLKLAYGKLVENLKAAIRQANWRVTTATSPTASRAGGSHYHERWFGSRRQLEASGFTVAGALPGDAAAAMAASIRDRRGYHATAALVSALWPDFFQVTVILPDKHRRMLAAAEIARVDLAAPLAAARSDASLQRFLASCRPVGS